MMLTRVMAPDNNSAHETGLEPLRSGPSPFWLVLAGATAAATILFIAMVMLVVPN
ncbi:MAG TPA: hypothetical protein VIL84_00910 [Devosiaceae bacterium]